MATPTSPPTLLPISPTPMEPARRFAREARGFTGAEKALLVCFALAIVALVGHLVMSGSQTAATSARRVLSNNGQALGSWQTALSPMGAAAPAGKAGEATPTSALEQAKLELLPRFEIIPDDFKGPRRPNQLTQAEFDKTAQLYADIRQGKTDIQWNYVGLKTPEAKQEFQDKMMRDLGSIMQTQTGRELVASLANQPNHHTLTLEMLYDAAGNPDSTNAYTIPQDWRKDADGKGTNSTIQIVPGHDTMFPGATDSWMPIRSDVTLFHEMVHAHHMMYGTMDNPPIRPGHGTPDDVATGISNAEYQAVGLGDHVGDPMTENKYRAERRRIGSGRGGVTGDATMPQRTTYVVHTAPAAPPP